MAMLPPAEVEEIAQQHIQDYVKSCECDSHNDVANVLMKLVSMCGLGMCAVVGQDEAAARMQVTADYIAATQAGVYGRSERANLFFS